MIDLPDFSEKIAADSRYCRKEIYPRKGGGGTATAVVLVGYCPDTLAYFQAIFAEAKKSFPDLDPAEVTCSKVRGSSYVDGFTVILFACPDKPVEGWRHYEREIDFRW